MRPGLADVTFDEWLQEVDGHLGSPVSVEGIEIEPLCTAEHPQRSADWPGQGAGLGESADHPWTICQSYDGSEVENLNQYLKDDLANGVRGVRLGSVSRESRGWAVDYVQAFSEPEAGSCRVLMVGAGENPLPSAAGLMDALERSQLMSPDGTLILEMDPLGALARRGPLPRSLSALEDDAAELVRFTSAEVAAGRGRALMVSTEAYREAGAEIDQEVGLALATTAHYLRALDQRGLSPEEVVSQLTLVTSFGQQTFLEIAKVRALRVLLRGLQLACGIESSPRSWIHGVVLERNLASVDPAINLLRITNAGLAAVSGGVDSLETSAAGFCLAGSPARTERRLTRNVQHILELESHLGRVRDPARGSYLLETLTQQVSHLGWAFFRQIERHGGALEALQSGWIQDQIAERWESRQRKIHQGEVPVLGVNVYQDSAALQAESAATVEATAPVAPDSGAGALVVRPVLPHRDSEPYQVGTVGS